ncbi:MAG: TonB-dependent receptor [Steroidobacteraceae bacterium]
MRALWAIAICVGLSASLAAIPTDAIAQAQRQTSSNTAGPPSPGGTPAAADQNLATVVVTGTSIQSAQAAAYQAAPVTIITSEDIQASGATNVQDYFQTQPDFVLSGQSSFSNFTAGAGANGTTIGASTLNLRGIGPQYTLVLVNGRRFQAEDPANLDLIPLDAIDRIEVLKSGASAVYGTDAVAGVVNIITKTSADGFSLGGYFGESSGHDDDTSRYSVSWGKQTDQLSFFAVAEYYDRGGITAGQRDLSRDPDLSRFNPNFNYQPWAYSSLGQIVLPNGTGPLVLNQTQFTCGQYSRNPANYTLLNPHLYATSCDALLDDDQRSLINPQRKGTFFANLDYKISDQLSVYSDFDFARSLTTSYAMDYGIDGFGDPNCKSQCPESPIPANYYWNPFGVGVQNVTYGIPEPGPQIQDIDSSAWRLNAGIKGALGRVNYDVGGAVYYDYTNLFQYNLPTNAGVYAAENRPGPEAINLFCNACNTPAQLAGVMGGASVQNWEEMYIVNAHAYAPVVTLPAGDFNFALGTEFQHDVYEILPSQYIREAGLTDDTQTPTDAGRRYTSVYAEAQLPIFGNSFAFPGAASLAIDAAARYQEIQLAGSRTDPSLNIRWEPIADTLAFRGSYGTSFRAPPLEYVYGNQHTGVDTLLNPVTGLAQDYQVITGGNPALKPETASYTTYGIALTPQGMLHGLTVTVDRWFIDQKNIVIQTNPQLVLDGVQPGTLFTAPNGQAGVESLYLNAAGQDVNGFDGNIDYRFRTEKAGAFDFRLAGTFLNSFKVNDSTGAGYVQYAGNTALATSLPTVTGLPKIRYLLTGNWAYQALTTTYLLHYAGSYIDPTIPGGAKVSSYMTQDIQFTLDCSRLVTAGTWWSGVKFTLGVDDLTQAKPPVFYAGTLGGGILGDGYDTSIVNPVGRFFYASVNISFPRHQNN